MSEVTAVDPKIPIESAEELYENAPCGYLSTLPNGNIVCVNQTLLNQTGYTRIELVGKKRFQDLLTVPGQVFFQTHFQPLLRIRGFVKEIACDLRRPGKSPMPVLVYAASISDTEGEPVVVRYMIFEAEERRRYETDLLQARRRIEHYAAIVEASADAIISMSPDGTIRTWNAGAQSTFGYSEVDAIGKKPIDIVELPAEIDIDKICSQLRSGQSVRGEVEVFARHSGRSMLIEGTLTPHIEPPEDVTSVSAIVRDITDRRSAEETKQKKELLQSLVRMQEEERRRIARDLHDHLGQQATGIRLALMAISGLCEKDSDVREHLARVEEQALQMDHDISRLAFELRPNVLNRMGLADAIRTYVNEWSQRYLVKAAFSFTGEKRKRLLPEIETNLYRIVQEALNNIGKHARAENVSVILSVRGDELLLIIEDDGVGFDAGKLNQSGSGRSGGFGLSGMRDRASILGGSFQIESGEDTGTAIYTRVPVILA